MENCAQMIITRWGPDQAVSLSSPQLPGIVAAYDDDPSAAEVMAVAREAGLAADGSVQVHVEQMDTIDDIQYFVRWREDYRSRDRLRVVKRVGNQLHASRGLREYADADAYGDVVLIAALPTDTIGQTLATAEAGRPVTVCTTEEGIESVSAIGIVLGTPGNLPSHEVTLTSLGLDKDSTIQQLLAASGSQSALRNHELVLV